MKFYSTNNKNNIVSFREAVLNGIANDGGLFMPADIPKLPLNFFQNISNLSFREISFRVAKNLLENDLSDETLTKIIDSAITFDAPLVKLNEQMSVLELFHGPTLAFKDFGARFMAEVMSFFINGANKEIIILVATSGDTGSAVANGFLNSAGIKVVLLYPSGRVSKIQEQQLTTLDGNITALEVDGTFDDCQRLVKKAFADSSLIEHSTLSSANSINIARLIPQSFYYFNAYARTGNKKLPFYVSVPSGNFGNLTGGLFAYKMGLPVSKFIAAVNANDVFPKYLETSLFEAKPSVRTLSNAMDVGNPSNFARILDLYAHNHQAIKDKIFSESFSDLDTIGAIKEVYSKYNYLMDPHGAVGYLALKRFIEITNQESYSGIFLETAHPSKFADIVEKVLNKKIDMPYRLQDCLVKKKKSIKISKEYEELKNFILSI